MSETITVTIEPDFNQVQFLLDTIGMYTDLCNYLSLVVHKHDHLRPANLYYWDVDDNHQNLYHQVRSVFPNINANFITLAFRKVAKAYKNNSPKEAYKFNDTLDCSKYIISMKFILPSPNNIGMLTISTLAGRQQMHFIFDDTQRSELCRVLNSKQYREYELIYRENTFYLIIDIKDDHVDIQTDTRSQSYQIGNNDYSTI